MPAFFARSLHASTSQRFVKVKRNVVLTTFGNSFPYCSCSASHPIFFMFVRVQHSHCGNRVVNKDRQMIFPTFLSV